MKRSNILIIILLMLLILGIFYFFNFKIQENTIETVKSNNYKLNSQLITVDYNVSFEGKSYDKTAVVYVPKSYRDEEPMNIFYLMHGSTMNGQNFAEDMQPYLDRWLVDKPMLVVFSTYYPDSSFVSSNYTEDYPLNHFFATNEIDVLMRAVERQFTTFAEDTTTVGFENSRVHRAFGGYSMGGITTWDILVEKSQYFYDYMPMAGDSWINRTTNESGDIATARTLVSGLKVNNYGSNDFKIIAMVGENDGTKYRMISQIEAIRLNYQDLISDENLIYWENDNGGHNWKSILAEVEHGIPYLFLGR